MYDNIFLRRGIIKINYVEPDAYITPSMKRILDGSDDENNKSGKNKSLLISRGDITKLKVDAIVNAANSSLLGGGGVDGAIHRAAGKELLEECKTLNGCKTGESKITKGYNLPAKYVIHTVGPIYSKSRAEECKILLENCYQNSINLAKQNNCHSVAFPLISAGVYGYPKKEALDVAVDCIKRYGKDLNVQIVLFDIEAIEIAQKNYPDLW